MNRKLITALKAAEIEAVNHRAKTEGVSEDFKKQVLGYGLTVAQILYRMPDTPSLLQTYVWQNYDLCPKFPALKDFLDFWQQELEGPLYAVSVAHSQLIKPAELRVANGVLQLH